MATKKGRPKLAPELPMDLSKLDLSLNEQKFVANYCANGFNGTDAIKKSGYKLGTKTASSMAWQLLQKEEVNKAIKLFLDSVLKPFRDKLEYELLNIYYRRATFSVSTFFTPNGNAKPLNDIPDEWHCCLDGVEKKHFGKDATRTVILYALPNRDASLNKLFDFVTKNAPTDNPDEVERTRKHVAEIFAEAMEGKMKIKDAVTVTQKKITKENISLAESLEKHSKTLKKK